MQLRLFRHLWGLTGSWAELFPKFKDLGYHGVEGGVPSPEATPRWGELLDNYGLAYVAQIFTRGATVAEHLDSFRQQVEAARLVRPLLINAHTGRDAWDEPEATRFYAEALRIEADAGIRVAHETHRGRVFYSPWTTRRMLERFPALELCCDFSHWVCVCERLLEDQLDSVRLAASRCRHLHARVGYDQGPQVPDPRAPEFRTQVEAHEAWWRMVWDAQEERGDAVSTLTPEFGPPPYQHTLPFTQAPVSDLWDICNWQAQRQAAHFARRTALSALLPSP